MLAMFAKDKHWPAESTRKKGKREKGTGQGQRKKAQSATRVDEQEIYI
jgi:hypothetical protein